jgi:hypothetical protein
MRRGCNARIDERVYAIDHKLSEVLSQSYLRCTSYRNTAYLRALKAHHRRSALAQDMLCQKCEYESMPLHLEGTATSVRLEANIEA